MSRTAAVEHRPTPDREILRACEFLKITEGRYRVQFEHAGVEVEIDRLRRKSDELVGEMTVRCDLAGALTVDDKTLSTSDFNFSSSWAREKHAGLLKRRARTSDLDWYAILETCSALVVKAERTGQAPVTLRDVARPDIHADDLEIHGFCLPRRHPAMLFGDGGTFKSYLALWIAGELARCGVRVGLFDWELDAADHRDRLERLFGSDMPALVWYTRCERPLVRDVERLRRIAIDLHLEYLIFDSVGYATEGAPETAEAALGYFQALRRFGPVGSLHLAHVSKAADDSDKKPFGSSFWHNSARATWFVKPTDDTADGIAIGIFERKRNLGAKRPPFGFEGRFTAERTIFQRVDLTDVPELAHRLSIAQRIRGLLKSGAMPRAQVTQELGGSTPKELESIRRTINREIEKGRLVHFPGPAGEERIGLAIRGDR